MGRGMQKEGLVFAADILNYFAGVLPDGQPDNIIFFCDVAWGGGDNLSMPVGYVYGSNIYIVSVVFDKRDKLVTKPRVAGMILRHKVKSGTFEADNGGHEYCDDTSKTLMREHNYSCNLTHRKAPSNQGKMARIEQHAPVIRQFYFLDDKTPDPDHPERMYRDEDYRKFMQDLTSYSFTAKNLHDDAPDSLAGMADCFYTASIPAVEYFRRPF
jgi:hypothetical protein